MQDTKGTKRTYFISGGGTGGHIYPAVAIAKALLADGTNKVLFIGNKKNLEYKICKENGINFLPVNVNYMPRKIGLNFIFWAIKTMFASLVCCVYILKHKPSAIFATGGYVSAPILIAGSILKIPFMTHDCDAFPGLVSRFFSKYSSATSIAFEEAKKHLKSKNTYFFGNPIREEFFMADKENSRKILELKDLPTLLIMGGSQGAKTLNIAAIELIEYFKNNENLQIILQTGAKNYDEVLKNVKEKLAEIPKNIIIAPYFDDLSIPLSASDLVISRAGSLSISEICAIGLPSILVPYPYSAADHQRLNAKIMEEIGASIYIDDSHCSGENLIKSVNEILFDPIKLDPMRIKAKKQSKPDATKNIIEKLKEIMK